MASASKKSTAAVGRRNMRALGATPVEVNAAFPRRTRSRSATGARTRG